MSAMASLITSLRSVYSIVYSRRRSKRTSNLRVTGLCVGNSPVTGELPAQMASNAENYSIWWRHHEWRPGRDGHYHSLYFCGFALIFNIFYANCRNYLLLLFSLHNFIQPWTVIAHSNITRYNIQNNTAKQQAVLFGNFRYKMDLFWRHRIVISWD